MRRVIATTGPGPSRPASTVFGASRARSDFAAVLKLEADDVVTRLARTATGTPAFAAPMR